MSLDQLRAGLAPQPRPGRRRLLLTLAAAATVVAALAALVWAREPTPRVVRRAQTAGAPRTAADTSSSVTTSPPVRVWPTTTLPPVVVHTDSGSYAVEAGGLTAVGRFGCGAPVLALVRGGSGDVYVFDTWASVGTDVVARPVGHVDAPRAVSARDSDSDGCDELIVVGADGAPVTLQP